MKKGLSLLLAAVLLLHLTACSMNVENNYNTGAPESEADPPAGGQQAEPEAQEPAAPAGPDEPARDEESPAQDAEPAAEPDVPEQDDGGAPAVYVSHTDVTLKTAGETFRLTVWDSSGNGPDTCTYTSEDPAVAVVDEGGGEVSAVAPGTTTITVQAEFGGEQQTFSCIVRCKWEEAEDKETALPASGGTEQPSLSDFYAILQEKYDGLDAMMVMEGELLENYYPGLSGIAAVEEIYIQETMISISNIAVGLVKLSDGASLDDVAAVQDILQARIDAQAAGGAWYPESCETWKQGVITSTSHVVGMFVCPDAAQDMADLFTESFGS